MRPRCGPFREHAFATTEHRWVVTFFCGCIQANFAAFYCSLLPTVNLATDARPRTLRSADTRTLLVSRTPTSFGDKAFIAAGPRVWNYLQTDLKQPDLSYSCFGQSLKTFLFGQRDQSAVWIRFKKNPLAYLLACLRLLVVICSLCCHVMVKRRLSFRHVLNVLQPVVTFRACERSGSGRSSERERSGERENRKWSWALSGEILQLRSHALVTFKCITFERKLNQCKHSVCTHLSSTQVSTLCFCLFRRTCYYHRCLFAAGIRRIKDFH